MKAELRQRAMDLGFDACRFTTADRPDRAAFFEGWISKGYQGEMRYLERNASKRTKPTDVMPAAKSIITLAVSYQRSQLPTLRTEIASESIKGRSMPTQGIIARYARSKDYHDVLAEPLKILTDYTHQLGGTGTQSLWYVDTGPFLERDLAQRAGLGFIGKHTNLISRSMGNWFFLAEIITNLDLEPDPSEHNRCGTCMRCIKACPTDAIRAPFELDSRRCISYLTIELKGSIPLEFRPAIGDRIFGCDDCLEVCPWNRFARDGRLMAQHVRTDLDSSSLLDLLDLDEAGFKERFAGTPIQRSKRRGLLRNVCVALGNNADESALPALERRLSDSELLVAEHAHWAMQEIAKRRSGHGRAVPRSNPTNISATSRTVPKGRS